MSEMAKRVEKAIDNALARWVQVNPYDAAAVERSRVGLQDAAIAAIEAMRVPTESSDRGFVPMTDDAAAFERGFVAGWRARERETALEQSARERDRSLVMQVQQMMGTMQTQAGRFQEEHNARPMPPRSQPA